MSHPEIGVDCHPRSLRLYPHLQDTGGFFVAVLQRKPKAKKPLDMANSVATKKGGSGDGTLKRNMPGDPATPERPADKKAKLVDVDVEMDGDRVASATSTNGAGAAVELLEGEVGRSSQLPDNSLGESEQIGGTFKEDPYTFMSKDDPAVLASM